MENISSKKFYLIILGVVIATAASLSSDLSYFTYYKLDFHQFSLIFAGSAITYPIIFAVTDMIASQVSKHMAIFIGLTIIVADGIFSNIPMMSHVLESVAYTPDISLSEYSKDVFSFAPKLSELWYMGFIASTITVIAEITIFSFFIKKINNTGLSIVISTALTLFVHNAILDWHMIGDVQIILGNYLLNIIVVTVYAAIIHYISKKTQ